MDEQIMNILDPDKIKFEKSKTGMLNIIFENKKVISRVHCIPMFPFSDTNNFISVAHKKGSEFEEIGIIKHLNELSPPQQNLVKEDMKFSYFVPEITDIKRIKRMHGLWEWDVVTDRGEKVFYLGDRRESIVIKDGRRIIITDIEKCRYKITRYKKLPAKAQIELEKMLL